MLEYYKNSEGIVIRGKKYKEHFSIVTEDVKGDEIVFSQKRNSVRWIMKGEVVIDEFMVYGLGEILQCENVLGWIKQDSEEVEERL